MNAKEKMDLFFTGFLFGVLFGLFVVYVFIVPESLVCRTYFGQEAEWNEKEKVCQIENTHTYMFDPEFLNSFYDSEKE